MFQTHLLLIVARVDASSHASYGQMVPLFNGLLTILGWAIIIIPVLVITVRLINGQRQLDQVYKPPPYAKLDTQDEESSRYPRSISPACGWGDSSGSPYEAAAPSSPQTPKPTDAGSVFAGLDSGPSSASPDQPCGFDVLANTTIHEPGVVGSGSRQYETDQAGSVREAQVFGTGEVVAKVECDGTIRRDGPLTFGGDVIGKIEADGTVRETGSFGGGRVIGRVGEDSVIRDNFGNVIGEVDKD